jgi:hypothetical protein
MNAESSSLEAFPITYNNNIKIFRCKGLVQRLTLNWSKHRAANSVFVYGRSGGEANRLKVWQTLLRLATLLCVGRCTAFYKHGIQVDKFGRLFRPFYTLDKLLHAKRAHLLDWLLHGAKVEQF